MKNKKEKVIKLSRPQFLSFDIDYDTNKFKKNQY